MINIKIESERIIMNIQEIINSNEPIRSALIKKIQNEVWNDNFEHNSKLIIAKLAFDLKFSQM